MTDHHTHPLDRLVANPPPEHHEIGMEPGEECGRYAEPDEDCPTAFRCNGEMIGDGGMVYCDTCWEIAR